MSLITIGRNGRVYQRRFDHEEARRRYEAGESGSSLAREYGVSSTAVLTVVSATMEKWRDSTRFKGAERCIRCGAPKSKLSRYTMGSLLCRSCADDDQATSVRSGELRCVSCRKWKPDAEFSMNRSETVRRRQRHRSCRVCQTRQRQEYRERHKVPCVGCGKPCLPPREKGTNWTDIPRCRSCASKQASADRRSREAVSPRGERGD